MLAALAGSSQVEGHRKPQLHTEDQVQMAIYLILIVYSTYGKDTDFLLIVVILTFHERQIEEKKLLCRKLSLFQCEGL